MQKSIYNSMLWIAVFYFSGTSLAIGQQKFTPTSYISEHKSLAQQLMLETGVPASVILSVAIHESAFGNSRIARYLNNHFGIKGKNNSTTIKSAYKGYESTLASYRDFISLLKKRRSTQALFDQPSSADYRSWVQSIARSGYSASNGWGSKVLATINRYHLDDYDKVNN